MVTLEKSLPSDPESERAVLGSILLNNHLIRQAAANCQPDDFYSQTNRRIYTAMFALHDACVEINPVTICHQLEVTGTKQQGDLAYCVGLTNGLPQFSNINIYVTILKQKKALRRFARLGADLSARAIDNDEINELASYAEATAAEIRQQAGVTGGAFRSFSEVAEEALQQYERLHQGDSRAVPTGYADLDRATRGGIQPGELWVVAALTGKGKSAWAIGAARQQALLGFPCAFVSREMSDFENFARAHSAISGVPAWRIQPGMWPDDYHALMDTWDTARGLPIYINSRTANIFEIRSQVRELVHGTSKVRALFVDYVQLMGVTLDSRATTRAQEVATVSRVLKEIALECEIGVFALAQFNRYAAHGERPEIHHLAESSGIEKDASLVLILDMAEPREGERLRDCKMRIAKHRNGPLLSLAYKYDGATLTFKSEAN